MLQNNSDLYYNLTVMPIVNVMKEKEMQNAYIGEYWEYKPTSNTIAYRPLTSITTNTNQKSGWTDLSTSWAVSYWVNHWVDCVTISDNSYLYGNISWLSWWVDNRTYSLWIYNENLTPPSNASEIYIWQWSNTSNNRCIYVLSWKDFWWWTAWDVYRLCYWSSRTYNLSNAILRWQWHHLVMTIYNYNYNWLISIFVNWTKILNNYNLASSYSYDLNATNYLWLWWLAISSPTNYLAFLWCFSDVILENWVRADADVLDYYNKTKSKYWIS